MTTWLLPILLLLTAPVDPAGEYLPHPAAAGMEHRWVVTITPVKGEWAVEWRLDGKLHTFGVLQRLGPRDFLESQYDLQREEFSEWQWYALVGNVLTDNSEATLSLLPKLAEKQ